MNVFCPSGPVARLFSHLPMSVPLPSPLPVPIPVPIPLPFTLTAPLIMMLGQIDPPVQPALHSLGGEQTSLQLSALTPQRTLPVALTTRCQGRPCDSPME